MIVLDTHVLIWWVNLDPLCPVRVRRYIQQHRAKSKVLVASMTFWEIAMLVKRGRLRLRFDLDTWIAHVEAIEGLEIVPMDHSTLVLSVNLPEPFHADPADRMIVATALQCGATLITKDRVLRKYPHVDSYW